jgi:hypothetical protein
LTGTTRDKRGCVGQAGTIPGVDENHREAITDADATGLIAGEKLITEAETLRPLLPHQHLHAALPQAHSAHATIDQLRAEIESAAPNRQTIEGHVRTLRALPELEAAVANWWDDPKTQRFIAYLSQIGL